MTTKVLTRDSTANTSWFTPVSSSSAMASTSEVSRATTRPEVYRSWNDRLRPWNLSNRRVRRS